MCLVVSLQLNLASLWITRARNKRRRSNRQTDRQIKRKCDIDGSKDRGKDSEPTVHGRRCMYVCVCHIRMCVYEWVKFSKQSTVMLKHSGVLGLFRLMFTCKQFFRCYSKYLTVSWLKLHRQCNGTFARHVHFYLCLTPCQKWLVDGTRIYFMSTHT